MGSKIESAVDWAVGIANDNSHGYSQTVRWGPSYDCSSLVISAYQQAGVPVKTRGATYTGNMRQVFLSCGFKNITGLVSLATGAGLKRGDVLLNDANHTAMMINSTQLVHARSSEGTTDTADNSGNEIRVQNYWNYPWNCVLRYPEELDDVDDTLDVEEINEKIKETRKLIIVKYPMGMNNPDYRVKAVQALLCANGYHCDVDGEFGPMTREKLKQFQRKYGLDIDGIAGQFTFEELLKGEN